MWGLGVYDNPVQNGSRSLKNKTQGEWFYQNNEYFIVFKGVGGGGGKNFTTCLENH